VDDEGRQCAAVRLLGRGAHRPVPDLHGGWDRRRARDPRRGGRPAAGVQPGRVDDRFGRANRAAAGRAGRPGGRARAPAAARGDRSGRRRRRLRPGRHRADGGPVRRPGPGPDPGRAAGAYGTRRDRLPRDYRAAVGPAGGRVAFRRVPDDRVYRRGRGAGRSGRRRAVHAGVQAARRGGELYRRSAMESVHGHRSEPDHRAEPRIGGRRGTPARDRAV
jgi:hypothetical protein